MTIESEPVLSRSRVNLALATLFLATFVLGTAELGPVGMLNLIAADLGVSISATGRLVTAYALGLAIGGPILAALTHPARPASAAVRRRWPPTSPARCSPRWRPISRSSPSRAP